MMDILMMIPMELDLLKGLKNIGSEMPGVVTGLAIVIGSVGILSIGVKRGWGIGSILGAILVVGLMLWAVMNPTQVASMVGNTMNSIAGGK